MKNRVKISIDGKSFTLVGEESEEHIRSVAAYIDEKMTEVREKAVAVTLDSSLAYVLTSVNVADDYFKEKAYTAELEGRLIGMTARVQELTHKLEEAEKARENAENKLDEYILAMEEQRACRAPDIPFRRKKIKRKEIIIKINEKRNNEKQHADEAFERIS